MNRPQFGRITGNGDQPGGRGDDTSRSDNARNIDGRTHSVALSKPWETRQLLAISAGILNPAGSTDPILARGRQHAMSRRDRFFGTLRPEEDQIR